MIGSRTDILIVHDGLENETEKYFSEVFNSLEKILVMFTPLVRNLNTILI